MAERLQALSTAAITQYLAQYHQAQAAMAALQQQHLPPTLAPQHQQFPPSNSGQQNPLQPNNPNINLNFGAAGGLPTTVEELAFINNFLIKLGEQIASGEYYSAGIPPPTAAASISMSAAAATLPAPTAQFANPYTAAALGAAGLGLGTAAGLGAAAATGGMYDPALLAHLGLSSGLGLHFPIAATPQQQPPSFGNGNPGAGTNHGEYPTSNGTVGLGSLYPSLFPQQQQHAPSSSSASPSGSPPLDAPVLANGVLGLGHSHPSGKGGHHHHPHRNNNLQHPNHQRSPSGTPEFDIDHEHSDVLSGTTAASHPDDGPAPLGSGPPQKRASSMSGSGSKRSRLDGYAPSSSPTQQQQQQQKYYEDMIKQELERHGSPHSSASTRSTSLRHSHSPAFADQHEFVVEQQQERQRQAYNNTGATPTALDYSQLLGPAYAANANVNTALWSTLGLGAGGIGGAGVSDAAKRDHIPVMGTYELGSAKPLVHAMPKVQTSGSASRLTNSVVKTEERDDEDNDDEDDYIRPIYSSSRDGDSDGEPAVGRLRRIRPPPASPPPADHSSHPPVPSISLSAPPSPSSSRQSHSRSTSSSSSLSSGASRGINPLPSYPTLNASLKLPAIWNVAGGSSGSSSAGGSNRIRRSSKASISSLASILTRSSRSTVSPGTTPRMGSTRSLPVQLEGDDNKQDASDRSDREDEDEEMHDAPQQRERERERVTLPGVSSILAAAAAGRDVSPPAARGHVDHIMGDLRGIALRSPPRTPHMAPSPSSPDPRSPKPSASTSKVLEPPSSVSSRIVPEHRRAHAELIGRLLVFINAEFAKRHPTASSVSVGGDNNSSNSEKNDNAGGPTASTRAARTTKYRDADTRSPMPSDDEDEDENDELDESPNRRGGGRGSARPMRRTTSSSSTATRPSYRTSSSRRIGRGDEDEGEENEDDNLDRRSPYSSSRGTTPQSLYPDLRAPIQMHRQVYAQ